ncbi:MAG TPA: Rieske 2Fe-2S domain-containing protein [Silvibacterium sp.]|nr:Rieske 2Fe-2S domain-containing protein [Silvibacterium sp.]
MTDPVTEEPKVTQDDPRVVSRRWMLLKLGVLINAAVGVAVAFPVVRYLLAPVKRKGAYNSWVTLGPVDQFPMGETRLATYLNPVNEPWDGDTAKTPCWVRHIDQSTFQVFAINCAHLGCPVRWFPQSGLFMCPCHGGVYYADGSRASGPPERGMFEYKYRIVGNELQISAGQLPTLSTEAKNVFRVLNNEKGRGPCAG